MAITDTARFVRQSVIRMLSEVSDITTVSELDQNGGFHIEAKGISDPTTAVIDCVFN